ncbi:MAG: chloride channel protein [Candidatus Thermoplasmatota archaeon]|nr:chloride channel protein [Candidatus Thermoplasmatota archaeon]
MFGEFQKTLRGYIRSEFMRDYGKLNVLAAIIGVFGAFIAIAFRWMIDAFQEIFFVGGSPLDNSLGVWIIVVPAIGAVFVGVIIYWLAPEVKGAGVADVMRGVVANRGRFRARVPALKALASAITLGSGGSGGREGPIVQIGASFASVVGQKLKLTSSELRIMVACGAAGAIAATFNTPIAGAVFALELLLLEFKTRSFVPLIVSSVFATLASRHYLGDNPTFALVAEYRLENPYELVFYLGLGLLAGLVGVLFIKVFYRLEDAFDAISIPMYAKPLIGASLVGAVGLFYPQALGVGYDSVTNVLNGTMEMPSAPVMAILFLGLLVIVKMLATSLTLGSGGSAGLFGPSLFLGAMLGAAFGIFVNLVSPFESAHYGAYAMVGMAALFAATSRATLTAILILFEMTSVYEIILPLMFACVVSDAVSSLLSKETIYTAKLAKQGIRYVQDLSVNVLESGRVRDAMTVDYVTVKDDTPLRKVVDMHLYTGRKGFPVISSDGRLRGIVTLSDVRKAFESDRRNALVRDVMTKRVVTVYPDETLQTALEKMVLRKLGHLPVVDPNKPNKLVGMLDKEAILDRYRNVLVEDVSEKSLEGRLME